MMNRSCFTEGGLRVREKISRDSGQCGCGVSAPQRGDRTAERRGVGEFEIGQRPEGFAEFFTRIEKHQQVRNCEVAVAMEGFNGCARPLDAMVRRRGYRLYNINNLKLARFKEIFPGAAKSDRIDARKDWSCFS
jgi:Transposase